MEGAIRSPFLGKATQGSSTSGYIKQVSSPITIAMWTTGCKQKKRQGNITAIESLGSGRQTMRQSEDGREVAIAHSQGRTSG